MHNIQPNITVWFSSLKLGLVPMPDNSTRSEAIHEYLHKQEKTIVRSEYTRYNIYFYLNAFVV